MPPCPLAAMGPVETGPALCPWDLWQGTAPGEVQDPSLYITLQAATHSSSSLPVSIDDFTWSGLTIIESTHKHTVPFHGTAQHLAGELSPSSLPSQPRNPGSLHW